jgi:hypothetical protein
MRETDRASLGSTLLFKKENALEWLNEIHLQ